MLLTSTTSTLTLVLPLPSKYFCAPTLVEVCNTLRSVPGSHVGGVWELVYFIPLYHLPGVLFVRTLRTLSRLLNRSTSWLSTVESELICPCSSGCWRRTKYAGNPYCHLIYRYSTAGLKSHCILVE